MVVFIIRRWYLSFVERALGQLFFPEDMLIYTYIKTNYLHKIAVGNY